VIAPAKFMGSINQFGGWSELRASGAAPFVVALHCL
jgi:hypothetical protein